MTHEPRSRRGERGFSMFLVIMAMFVTAMFVAAGFAAANGDLPMSGQSKDRKAAYTAAEAGLNFYLTHINQDSDYWTKCENVPGPTASEPKAPVNQPWNGKGTDPRIWRTIPGSTARYTIELLPVGYDPKSATPKKCDPNDSTSMIDLSSGMFRIRATGEASKASGDAGNRRSIVASFRRSGFLDFLYFTYYEDLDPMAMSTTTARNNATKYCAGLFRKSRPAPGAPNGACQEIQFAPTDVVSGPLHSNDSLLVCNSPTFGRDNNNKADRIEVSQYPNPTVAASGCSNSPKINGVFKAPAETMNPPASNRALRVVAQNGGALFTGKTFIRLNGTTMNVTTTVGSTRTYFSNMALPDNGVIYVQSDSSGSCTTQYPTAVNYSEENTCGNVYVSGTYSKSLTIAADNDVIVAPTDGKTLQWGSTTYTFKLDGDSNAVLGLIANNFVRVGHPVVRGSTCSNATDAYDNRNLQIDAAILSIDHSFIVDNYDCGSGLGDLQVNGAIAQRYRGAVGRSNGNGFIKDYEYDDRLKYRSPPHFINPVDSAWAIVRSNEQVPSPGN